MNRPRIILFAGVSSLFVAAALSACSSAPVAPVNPTMQAAVALNRDAGRLLARGDTGQALADYRQVLSLAESLDDAALIGGTLLNVARVHAQRGERAQAHAAVDRILGRPDYFGASLQTDASIRKVLLAIDEADAASAGRWVDAARASCAAPCARGATLANLQALLAFGRNDVAAASTAAQAALASASTPGEDHERANALRLLGRIDSGAGRFEQAAAAFEQALAIDRRLGLHDRIALDLLHAADNERGRGRTAAARALLERALVVYSASGNTAGAALVRTRLAQAEATQ